MCFHAPQFALEHILTLFLCNLAACDQALPMSCILAEPWFLHEDFFGFFLPLGQGSPGRKRRRKKRKLTLPLLSSSSAGQKGKLTLRHKFPAMTPLETAWLRMALKLYRGFKPRARDLTRLEIAWLRMALKLWRGFKPHARDLRATEDSSFLAIKCILALIAAK